MTRYLLAGVCLGIAELAFLVAVCLSFHNRGFKRGRNEGWEQGFEAGKLREESWWLEAEQSVAQARQQIWREEPICGEQTRGDEIEW